MGLSQNAKALGLQASVRTDKMVEVDVRKGHPFQGTKRIQQVGTALQLSATQTPTSSSVKSQGKRRPYQELNVNQHQVDFLNQDCLSCVPGLCVEPMRRYRLRPFAMTGKLELIHVTAVSPECRLQSKPLSVQNSTSNLQVKLLLLMEMASKNPEEFYPVETSGAATIHQRQGKMFKLHPTSLPNIPD
ncbi:uncharacterized protein [Narcine bancroftii]|uniref:uncharacterized protein isoform X2 n=1 Tax=Narcine bancroftii TaxID=1343680 RepID=UPI003831E752